MGTLAILTLTLVLAGSAQPQQPAADGRALLLKYLQGERTLGMPTPFDTERFIGSIRDAIDRGLPGPPEHARRATAAFLLEAALARLDAGDVTGSQRLVEFACERVRAHSPGDDFDAAWFNASLSLADAWLNPNALENHVRHVRSQRPDDPVATLSWALAAEQRASPAIAPRPPAEADAVVEAAEARRKAEQERLLDDANARLALALANPSTVAEARVRTAHMQLTRGQAADALTTLRALESSTREGWVVYLARLFRGQAFEATHRPDDAATSYRDALKVGPNGHSATMALAALLFLQNRPGTRDEATALVHALLADNDPISDPWWTYWAGGARLWNARLKVLRERLQ